MKRICSLLLAAVLLCALGAAGYASGEASGSSSSAAAEKFVSEPLRGASALYVAGGEHSYDGAWFYGAGFSEEDDLSAEYSSKYGFCSTVLASAPGTKLTLNDPTIVSLPDSYANGVFAANSAVIDLNGGVILTNNSQGHGLDVTFGGKIRAKGTLIHTGGGQSGALASDFGGGFILADGIDCTTESGGSPGIYCAGASVIYCENSSFRANNCEGVMSAHDHGIAVLKDCYTYGMNSALNGHQAMPNPAQSAGDWVFVFGGTLASGNGPIINENNGRTETTVVGAAIELAEGYENVIEADDDANGVLTVNLWDTEFTGNVYCGEGASVTVNLYDGGVLTGEVTGAGEVVINVFDGGEYNGSFAAVEAGPSGEKPVCGDFDYYLTNYWAIGNKWSGSALSDYVDKVEPIIAENSAVTFIEPGVSGTAFDAETYDPSEGGGAGGELDVSGSAISGNPWGMYLDYAADQIRASEEPEMVETALDTLYNESNEKEPDGWPFDMFVADRGLFLSYEDYLNTVYNAE